MKRRWLLLFAACVVAVLGAGWLLVPFEAPRITQANCDRIQLGWSRQQVEDVLCKDYLPLPQISPDRFTASWSDDEGNEIVVGFRPSVNAVTYKHFQPTALSLWERIQRRIQRRLPAWRR
ncbi:MAG TPA: hypothetical protein VG099_17120 [Gemmataceae bacterium]|jgi:hypothetical protein|nr:hypothetical protein [Gemmataceae bacterium]